MSNNLLDDILARVNSMDEESQQVILNEAVELTKNMAWIPNPGPQTDAYFSEADVLLFGGSPGGGKSALEIGLGLTAHNRTLIVRKSFSDLEGLIDNAKKMVGSEKDFIGGARPKYKKPDGGVIHFAGLAQDGGIGGHQGVDHDLICVDEAATVPENQVRLLMGWMRTDIPGQRCRMVLASNPPLDSVGDWLVVFFAPWLDDRHPNPAKPGELRYFLPDDNGKDRECNKSDFTIIGGEKVYAQSRTFIPSKFTDNPFYNPEQYAKSLAGLPPAAREILVTGNFMLGRKDDLWQCIPTDWVKQAQARWTINAPEGVPMCTIGVDVANGGEDETILAPRYDGWFAPLIAVPGKETPEGRDVAALVVKHRRDGAKIIIDMGGGYGGAPMEHLKDNKVDVVGHKGAEKSTARTADRQLTFYNKRSEVIWKFREALDPSQPGGSHIMLPDDPMLVSDLTAPTYRIGLRGIEVQSKEDVCKKLMRSTDRGDAVVMAWSAGAKIADSYNQWKSNGRPQPKAILGHQNKRRR